MKKRGRPKDAGNRKHRTQDREDCTAIARLRLAEPELSIWSAICRITGASGKWRHQRARERRLHRNYTSHESRYVYLAQLAAQLTQPAPPGTVNDFMAALDLGARLRSMFEAEEKARNQLMRDFMASQEELGRTVRAAILDGPGWPELHVGCPLPKPDFSDPLTGRIFGKKQTRES